MTRTPNQSQQTLVTSRRPLVFPQWPLKIKSRLPREWYVTKSLRPQPKRLPLTSPLTIASLRSSLQVRLDAAFASSTTETRVYLAATLRTFLQHYQWEVSSESVLLCLEWMSATAQARTLLKYGRVMAAMFPVIKDVEYARWCISLAKESAKIPIRQVEALTWLDLSRFLASLPMPLRWMVWLAWKTSSRWEEIMALDPSDVLSSVINGLLRVVIDFSWKTKSSKTRPFRPDMLVNLQDKKMRHKKFLEWTMTRRPHEPFTTVTADELRTMLRKFFPGRYLGTVSLKAGAITHLHMEAALGRIPLPTVIALAKHQTDLRTVPDHHVRYGRNKVALAVALGSGAATLLL